MILPIRWSENLSLGGFKSNNFNFQTSSDPGFGTFVSLSFRCLSPGILQEMKAANCSPDVISYNSALGAIDRAGGGKEERDAWFLLRRAGFEKKNVF